MVPMIVPCLVHRFSALHFEFPKCQHLFAEFGKIITKRERVLVFKPEPNSVREGQSAKGAGE